MITKEKITALWNFHSGADRAVTELLPLYGGDQFWQVEAKPVIPVQHVALTPYTKFSDINTATLINLRRLVISKVPDALLSVWLEKLLRFTEINLKSLHNKIAGKENRFVFTWQLLSLFIDHYFTNRDARFLNTALKLFDLDWLNAEMLLSDTPAGNEPQVFAVRNHMLIEFAIHKLKNEP